MTAAAALLFLVVIASALLAGSEITGSKAQAGSPAAASGQGNRVGSTPIRFGIFPGGGVGSVNPVLEPRPENRDLRLEAIQRLRSGHPFVAHLYRTYWGGGAAQAEDRGLDGEIESYTGAGISVEVVARFRPTTDDRNRALNGYEDYVRALIQRYGANSRFVGLQVTNEANLEGAADASDGSHGAALEALVRGVQAAGDAVRVRGASQVKIGFNWAWESGAEQRDEFWEELGRLGGSNFRSSVDWVGLNAYPDTWTPLVGGAGSRHRRAGRTLVSHLGTLRNRLMPRAGLDASIPLHVTENGWPTGSRRSPRSQKRFLKSMIRAVADAKDALNVTDYRWFDLRDGNSSDSNFESHYGLMTDRYVPKPAFFTLRDEIAKQNGEKLTGKAAVGICLSRLRLRVRGRRPSGGWRFRKLRVATAGLPVRFARVNGKRAARLRGRRVARKLVLTRIPRGRARVRVRLSKKRHGRIRIKTIRRRALVCAASS